MRRIEVTLRREAGQLVLGYLLQGEVQTLSLPEFAPLRRGERLWQHSCFEFFVAGAGTAGYYEYNFAPSGLWAAYRLEGYRSGMRQLPDSAPEFSVQREHDRLQLDARVELPAGLPSKLHIGLSAVVEDAAGVLSYWAFRHAPDKPDFHHANAFALHLDGAGRVCHSERSEESALTRDPSLRSG